MLSLVYVNGKDSLAFNGYIKLNYDNVDFIIHDSKAGIVKIGGNFEEQEADEISAYYNALPVFDEIAKAKRKLKDKVNEYRDYLTKDTFNHTIDGVVYPFNCDDRSAIRLTALVQGATYHIGKGLEFTNPWRTADNRNVTLTAEESVSLFSSARKHESDTVFKAVYIKEQIDAANYGSIEEINAIDVVNLWDSTQWPQT